MRNPHPNTTGLIPFTSERAKEVASRPRKAKEDLLVQSQVRLFPRQIEALQRLGVNRSVLVRSMIDAYLKELGEL